MAKNPKGKNFTPRPIQEKAPTKPAANISAGEVVPRPKRPGFGTKGKKVQVYVNLFAFKFDPSKTFCQYDIKIQPKALAATNRLVFRELIQAAQKEHPRGGFDKTAYDGESIAMSPVDLNLPRAGKSFTVEVEFEGERRKYTIDIKKTKELDMSTLQHYLHGDFTGTSSVANIEAPYDRIMALEIASRHLPGMQFATSRKGAAFFSQEGRQPIKDGLDLLFGWCQSIRPSIGPITQQGVTYKQLLLNIDVAATAFYAQGPLINVMLNFFGIPFDPNQNSHDQRTMNELRTQLSHRGKYERMVRYIRNVKVKIAFRNTGRLVYAIKDIAKSADEQTFEMEENGRKKKISVKHYFRDQYNVDLRYSWLPCIRSGTVKTVFVPIELCTVVAGQRFIGKLNDLQTADVIKVTAVPPAARKAKIEEGMRALHSEDKKFLESWGVSIDTNMMKIDARVLPPASLDFQNKSVTVDGGEWRVDSHRLSHPGTIKSWAVAAFKPLSPNEIQNFLSQLLQCLQDLKIQIEAPSKLMDLVVFKKNNVETTLAQAVDTAKKVFGKENPVDIVICILPTKNSDYPVIKKVAETRLGIMTQCCLDKHVSRPRKPYFYNLALKINAKIGGTNFFLTPSSQQKNPVRRMIVGADVTHGQDSSIAAVVASVDDKFTVYRSSVRSQGARKEIISEIKDMMIELLNQYRDYNEKQLPQQILLYRDGVSEGQFGEVVYNELKSIKAAFKDVYGQGQMPKITFLIMSKRHNVRFFPVNPKEGDRSGNVKPGTVVDTDIVHPYEFDFFLNSHPGLQGTSRAAHYHVLYDEIGFPADALQELTFRLCHLFCRSTRAVSIVPAVYYAHLLAARARCYESNERGTYQFQKVARSIQDSMYFV